MRGALIIIVLITMLIVGILVIKDYHTASSTNSKETKKVYIDKTKQAVKAAEQATNRIKQAAENLND
ncbi:MAG: hypothetical protein KAR45_03125 [Desulfobacteraceae bacterium]|nr:hypothetical protein [Desulfobacteraceae bacterium]